MYRREPIFAQSLTGLHRMPWIRWRGPSWTLEITDIVAQPTQRQHPSTLRRGIAPGAMHGAKIEQHRIAGLHLPLENLQSLFLIWIGRLAVSIRIPVKIALIGPVDGFYAFFPAVRAGQQAQSRLAHRVHGDPETDALLSFDKVIGDVLMPGRGFLRPRLLDQHMVMEELRRTRTHDGRGNSGGRRLLHRCAKLWNPLPIAIVIKKTTRFVVLLHVVAGVNARLRQVAFDTGGNRLDPISENTAQANRAIALERFDIFFVKGECAVCHDLKLLEGGNKCGRWTNISRHTTMIK